MANNLSNLKAELLELLDEEEIATNEYMEMLTPSSTSTVAEQAAARERLETIYYHRKNLYNLIQTTLDINNVTEDLVDKTYQNTEEVNDELRVLLAQTDTIKQKLGEDKITKQQLIAANTNYGKQYKAYHHLFIVLIVIFACLIVVYILSFTPLMFLTRPLNILIYIIGGGYAAYVIIDMLMKSNINNDEYNWMLSPNNNETKSIFPTITGTLGAKPKLGGLTSCVGEYCCDEANGTVWSDDAEACVVNTETPPS
jgi:hypothetical protein